jgi:hypothetical protein
MIFSSDNPQMTSGTEWTIASGGLFWKTPAFDNVIDGRDNPGGSADDALCGAILPQ